VNNTKLLLVHIHEGHCGFALGKHNISSPKHDCTTDEKWKIYMYRSWLFLSEKNILLLFKAKDLCVFKANRELWVFYRFQDSSVNVWQN
jgi:hypothetical protein